MMVATLALGACNSDEFTEEEPLSNVEASSLQSTTKQEKLGRDVYLAMQPIWRDRVFDVNADAHQRHLDRLQVLAEEHQLRNTGAGDPPGSFADPAFQQRYDRFVAVGTSSRVDALRVGVELEENAVADFTHWAGELVRDELEDAYVFMACESRNQLRDFHAELTASGGSYESTRLGAAGFALVVGTPVESC